MTFLDALSEVTGDTTLVDRSPAGAVREARANLWSFTLTQEQARGITIAQVEQFLHAVIGARSRELVARHGGHPMYFYCWCDEQAAHLRFSLVSVLHGQLPFAGPITTDPELHTIIACFLAFQHHDGIPLDAGIPLNVASDACREAAPADSAPPPLAVWLRQLPVQSAPPPE